MAALTQNNKTITTQAQFNQGALSQTTVTNNSGGEVQLATKSDLSNAGGGSWPYKRTMTVNNPGSALTDHQVQVPTDFNYTDYDTADSSLKGVWHFSEGGSSGTTADSSGNNNTGTLSIGANGTQTTTTQAWTNGAAGRLGQGLNFDGNDDQVTTAIPTTATTNISMELWVYWRATSDYGNLFYNGNPGANGYGLFLNNGACGAGNYVTVLLGGISCNATSSTYILPTNQWTHLALTRDTTTWRFYVNGVLNSTGTANPVVPTGNTSTYLNGKVDEQRIYTRTLTAQEALDHANLNYGVNAGLVGSWHLNGGTNGSIVNGATAGFEDTSGNTNNGTVSNANGTGMAWAAGKFGGSVNFDGIDDYINAGTNSSLQVTTNVSIEAWVKTTDTAGGDVVTRLLPNSPWDGYGLKISAGKLGFWYGNNTAWDYTTATVNDGNWHHVALSFDSANTKFYIDGSLSTTVAKTGTVRLSSASTTYIGAEFSPTLAWPFKGQIDDVKIYNRIVSAAEFAYRAGVAGVPKVNGDYSDLRFTDLTGATEYSYWLENDKKAWVKAPSLAGTGTTNISMYYGNSSAASSSNGDNTFQFFDNFESGNLNKWTSNQGWVNATDAVYAGTYSAKSNITSPISISKAITNTKAIYEGRARFSNTNMHHYFSLSADNQNPARLTYWVTASSNGYWQYYDGVAYYNFPVAKTYAANTWYKVKMEFDYSQQKYWVYVDDILLTPLGLAAKSDDGTIATGMVAWTILNVAGGETGTMWVDDLRVRTYTATEPSISFGTEASSIATTGTYLSSSTVASGIIDLFWNGGWGTNVSNFSAGVTVPANTNIVFAARTSDIGGADGNWSGWTTLGTASSTGTFSTPADGTDPMDGLAVTRYIQIKATLNGDGASTPVLNDFNVLAFTDTSPPTNPVSASAWTDSGKGTPINDNTWHNNTSIYLEWPAGTEPLGESGVKGYWVYFGTNESGTPVDIGSYQTSLNFTPTISASDSGKDRYLRIQTEDNAGNRSAAVTLFTYRFDATAPANPPSIERSPVGWSNVNSFSFTWTAGTDTANAFGNSGVAGYEYKRATDVNWNSTTELTVSGIQAYQNGTNLFYVRTRDNAGNVSDGLSINYYYSLDAPSAPQNLSVTPNNNTENAFSFSWSQPATFNGTIKGYRWSVNAVPSVNNTVYLTALTTGVIPAATQQGLNTFYIVAIDNTDNVNYANYASIQFEANTTAPGAPLGPTISDISNRDSSNWALALSWQAPQTGGTVDHYIIERSLDNSSFAQTGTSSTTTFAEAGLDNTKIYYYHIIAVDNAASLSAPSTVVAKQPTGKYTTPPKVVTGPDAAATAIGAVVTWSTDRASSSFVEYGKDTNYGLSNGSLEPVTSHSVTVSGLSPGTTYHFRVQSLDDQRDYDPTSAYSSDYTFTTSQAPGISEVKVSDVRLDSAIVTWKTTSSATSNIKYGKTNTYGKEIVDSSGSSVTTHTIKLTELDHSSTYHFKITGTDIDNNYMQSDDYSFDTLTYPKVSDVRFEQQKNTATSTLRVTWTSNVPLTSIVEYREGSNGKTSEVSKSGLIVSHDLLVPTLKDNTEYYMVVRGRDAYGNEAVSDTNKVKTDYDTRPPQISEITTESSISGYGLDTKAQVIVSWFTDESSTSQVEYAEGVSGETFSSKTPQDTSLTTSHVVVISDLKPSASYYFRVISRDSAKNESLSETNSVLTEQARSSVIDVIIKSFESTLGWLLRVGR